MVSWADKDYGWENPCYPEDERGQGLYPQFFKDMTYMGPEKLSAPPRMPVRHWHAKEYGPYRCERCGRESADAGCSFCGGKARREAFL